MVNIQELRSTKEKWYDLSSADFALWIDSYKQAAESKGGISQLEYLLVQLIANFELHTEFDWRQVEDIYTKLVKTSHEFEDEDSFPFVLKLEFLKEMTVLFWSCLQYTRTFNILNILESLSKKHSDVEFGYVHVYSLLSLSADFITLLYKDVLDLISIVNQLEVKYNFDEETLKLFEFK